MSSEYVSDEITNAVKFSPTLLLKLEFVIFTAILKFPFSTKNPGPTAAVLLEKLQNWMLICYVMFLEASWRISGWAV